MLGSHIKTELLFKYPNLSLIFEFFRKFCDSLQQLNGEQKAIPASHSNLRKSYEDSHFKPQI